MKSFLPLLLVASLAPTLIGCGSSKSDAVIPANAQAVSDPNGRAQALLAEFDKLGPDDQSSWVQQHTFDFAVFDKVTDPALKAQYDAKIRPLGGFAK